VTNTSGSAVEDLLAIADSLSAIPRALRDVVEMLDAGYTRKLRERCGITSASMAETLGCAEAEVADWERGIEQPRFDLALRLQALMRELERQLIEDGRMGYAIGYTPVPAVVMVPAVVSVLTT